MSVVYIHRAGNAGAVAWPIQAAEDHEDWFFLTRGDGGDEVDRDARRIREQLRPKGGGHVVAHSYGANAALLAVQAEPALVHTLTLLEPACFDLARGKPSVEEHIIAMAPVFEAAEDQSVSTRDFSRLFAAGMGFEPPDLPEDELGANVKRLRALRPPWGLGLETKTPLPVSTFVITGRWSTLYEETAQALVVLGARHQVLEGAGHRVQDAPGATDMLRGIWEQSRAD